MKFTSRLARFEDVPRLTAVMDDAIAELQRAFLDDEQIEASRAVMGIDTQLIEDGTYFVVETPDGDVAGCGGWGRRGTMYGNDHSPGRDAKLLDPAVDAARVRAMYTSPVYARRGVGRLVLSLCEAAAGHGGLLAARAGRDAVRRTALPRVRFQTARADRGLCGRRRGARRPDGQARQRESAWLTPFRGVHAALPATSSRPSALSRAPAPHGRTGARPSRHPGLLSRIGGTGPAQGDGANHGCRRMREVRHAAGRGQIAAPRPFDGLFDAAPSARSVCSAWQFSAQLMP